MQLCISGGVLVYLENLSEHCWLNQGIDYINGRNLLAKVFCNFHCITFELYNLTEN